MVIRLPNNYHGIIFKRSGFPLLFHFGKSKQSLRKSNSQLLTYTLTFSHKVNNHLTSNYCYHYISANHISQTTIIATKEKWVKDFTL